MSEASHSFENLKHLFLRVASLDIWVPSEFSALILIEWGDSECSPSHLCCGLDFKKHLLRDDVMVAQGQVGKLESRKVLLPVLKIQQVVVVLIHLSHGIVLLTLVRCK